MVSLMMLLSAVSVFAEETAAPLTLTEIGMFSAGGTVTEPVEGDYDPTTNWMDATALAILPMWITPTCCI